MSQPPVGPGQPSEPRQNPPSTPTPPGGGQAPPPPPPPPPPPSYGEQPPPSYGDQPPPSAPPTAPSYGEQPPPPPGTAGGWGAGPAGSVTGERPGELLDRFVARLIDHVLLGVVNAIIASILVVSIIGLDAGNGFGMIGSTGGSFAAAALISIIDVAISLGYFAFMDSSQGRTIGKMVMKLRVVGASGGHPTVQESVKRNIWIAFGLAGIIPFLGIVGSLASLVAVILIAVGINKDTVARRPWTDELAGTRVVKEA
ncbi:RDD family protein [Nocardioides marmoribigeumensis]|uniref:RDD family membrane protein YckC n=1 Tax=Nocardioides marmoribigeumensis TaxID=433649 RepID=A0ABU2BWB6_9ACTN|nr:RDD family protein [Nocardioides marmoribigeumensis]MDR7362309.1 putative RDD family membrane protein YckC [Nocardioides marmoribigeumensis]